MKQELDRCLQNNHHWITMTEHIKLRDIKGTKVDIEICFCYQCGLFDDVYPSG